MSKYVPFEAEDTMQNIKYTSIASRVNVVLECVPQDAGIAFYIATLLLHTEQSCSGMCSL